MILSVSLNPCVDHALFVDRFRLGDTNRVLRTETDAGGKGINLSRVVAELGGKTVATGFLGGGPGAFVRQVLQTQGVVHDFVDIATDTRMNFSVEDANGGSPTTLNECGPTLSASDWETLLRKVSSYASGASWLALGGSLPPGICAEAFAQLVCLGHDHGCRVLLDADGEPMHAGLEAKPDFIKPNSREASRLVGRPVETLDEARDAAIELRGRGPSIVVVSCGKDGAVLATEGQVLVGASPEVEVRSTIGSGDSLLGAMLWAIGGGRSLEEAFRWGLAAGAATAATDGSQIARRPMVESLLPHAAVSAM